MSPILFSTHLVQCHPPTVPNGKPLKNTPAGTVFTTEDGDASRCSLSPTPATLPSRTEGNGSPASGLDDQAIYHVRASFHPPHTSCGSSTYHPTHTPKLCSKTADSETHLTLQREWPYNGL